MKREEGYLPGEFSSSQKQPIPPAEGKDVVDLKQYMTNMVYYVRDNAKDMNSAQFDKWAEEHINGIAEFLKQQQPTAEGAEEIDLSYTIALLEAETDSLKDAYKKAFDKGEYSIAILSHKTALKMLRGNTTLHAQKIADKMYADTEADGYVFCGKCGKMKEI